MGNPLKQTLIEEIEKLPTEHQTRVLDYVRSLTHEQARTYNKEKLMELAGSITKEDADLMMKVISEDCGRIDHENW
jgi:myo-inositol catabolism protein IolC